MNSKKKARRKRQYRALKEFIGSKIEADAYTSRSGPMKGATIPGCSGQIERLRSKNSSPYSWYFNVSTIIAQHKGQEFRVKMRSIPVVAVPEAVALIRSTR